MKTLLRLAPILIASCTSTTWIGEGYVAQIRPADKDIPSDRPEYRNTVQIQWLGVAGYWISLDGHAVLLSPFFSKQSILRLAFSSLEVNTALIDRKLPPVEGVEAILVGHAHYDHLLDVPYIATRHATAAPIYGSRTAVNILAGFGIPAARRIEVARDAWTYTASRRIRFAAFRSEHAPHVGRFVHLWAGEVPEPLTKPPTTARDFQEGLPLSYLIEFLDARERPIFAIFYQDSATTGGVGFPTIPHRPVDVAILTVPSWKNVDRYPEDVLVELRPDHVVLTHFDDFFADPEREMSFLFHDDTEQFLKEAQRILREHAIPAVLYLPYPNARLNFPLR